MSGLEDAVRNAGGTHGVLRRVDGEDGLVHVEIWARGEPGRHISDFAAAFEAAWLKALETDSPVQLEFRLGEREDAV